MPIQFAIDEPDVPQANKAREFFRKIHAFGKLTVFQEIFEAQVFAPLTKMQGFADAEMVPVEVE